MGVTIRDVAQLAEVSIATVSRALRDHATVSEATKRRVVAAAEQLGYAPAQRTAATEGARRVAVITPFVSRWFFGRVIEGIERVLRDRAVEMTLVRAGVGVRHVIPPDLHLHGVHGVIAVCLSPEPGDVRLLAEKGIPVVVLGIDHPTLPHVRIDDMQAARMAARHLIELGHERIGIVTGLVFDTEPFQVQTDRRTGFRKELADAGLLSDGSLEVAADYTTAGAMRAVQALFDLAEPPTAILAESDEMAYGVIMAARQRGIRVPEDLSVVGFDDHELASVWDLTTVAQPVDAQGEMLAWQVIAQMSDHGENRRSVIMPTTLIVRGSTRSRW